MEECLKKARAEETRITFGLGIVGHVAQTKEITNIIDTLEVSNSNSLYFCNKLLFSTPCHSFQVVLRLKLLHCTYLLIYFTRVYKVKKV